MDNTVGSLTQLQRSVIIGSLLGDGYMRIISGRKNAFLEINHSINQKEYVDWKYKVLGNISISPPKQRKGNGARVAYRFFTRQHPELSEFYYKFYRNGKKIIPGDEINPVILAVWYMDDGSKCRPQDVYLNTQQFTYSDQLKLIKLLRQMGLTASLNKDKEYFRIRFLKSSLNLLNKLIAPNIISSMQYKLGFDPVETTRRSPKLQQ